MVLAEWILHGFLAMVAEFLLGSLAWWTIAIAIGYLLATVSMGTICGSSTRSCGRS